MVSMIPPRRLFIMNGIKAHLLALRVPLHFCLSQGILLLNCMTYSAQKCHWRVSLFYALHGLLSLIP